jgi:aminopeptidase N
VRSVIDNDAEWFKLLHDYYQHFKYQTIMTTDMVAFFNQHTGLNLTPLFDEYLRHAAIPVLELKFDAAGKRVAYRWRAEESGFAMPVRAGKQGQWQLLHPTSEWQWLDTDLNAADFSADTDYYYIDVSKQ